ncbi:hypothetical protein [Streptomyces sp. cmx-4-25]|uniref:hypothetical protein n=1 Tax=unclassified Streptomyces TaxID=2593676 RepID=UPI00397FED79
MDALETVVAPTPPRGPSRGIGARVGGSGDDRTPLAFRDGRTDAALTGRSRPHGTRPAVAADGVGSAGAVEPGASTPGSTDDEEDLW